MVVRRAASAPRLAGRVHPRALESQVTVAVQVELHGAARRSRPSRRGSRHDVRLVILNVLRRPLRGSEGRSMQDAAQDLRERIYF